VRQVSVPCAIRDTLDEARSIAGRTLLGPPEPC